MSAGIERMTWFARQQSTRMLCEALQVIAGKPKPDEAERMTRAVLLDVLCERHPAADAAFDAWADSDSTDHAEAIRAVVGAAMAQA